MSDEMMDLLKKNRPLVKALLKSMEEDIEKSISSIKSKLQNSIKSTTDGVTGFIKSANSMGLNLSTNLDSVLNDIQNIKASGRDLNEMQTLRNIENKAKSLANGFKITQRETKNLLVELSAIKAETDSIKAEQKITDLINRLSDLYTKSGSGNEKFKALINGLSEIAKSATKASEQLQFFQMILGDSNKATDPKKSPFYQYSQMIMNSSERIKAEMQEKLMKLIQVLLLRK
ncbi:hypothetical protein [uncultured Gilliamella sp.]|uniref:hypothetical protein n=1 Tax=uncultured Gilliamella sp. TaxID=1193505 RepID=UPI0025F2B225|nr:hypothetical protein [uncultured Gilliamella sp.]